MTAPLRLDDPTHIGPYELRARLGTGGMGVVYLAAAPGGQAVAVKAIHPHLARDPVFRARFRAEVTAARRVPQFSTAAVLDADPDGPRPYLVTDYVPGPTLTAAVRRGPLAGAELEQVAVAVATALTVIHRAGVVHRDLTPRNVLLSPTGPRVIDFGIARHTDPNTTALLDQEHLGTPAYMAPEQLDDAIPAPPMDIFAWGGVVLFAATGRPPFGTQPPAALHDRIRHEQPPALDQLPRHLRVTVTAAMAKNPADRPTADQLYQALVSAPPPTLPPRTSPARPQPSRLTPTDRWVPDTDPQPAIPPGPRRSNISTESPTVPARPPSARRAATVSVVAVIIAAVLTGAINLLTHPTHGHDPSRRLTAAVLSPQDAGRILTDQATRETNPSRAARLAVAAYHLDPTDATRTVLLSTATRALPPVTVLNGQAPTTTDDTTVLLFDLDPLSADPVTLTSQICTTLGPLTEQEWHQALPNLPYQTPCR